ncbi:MAG TPA: histidine--tRNA ligase [bacterium]|nr:histidine--tRNA ligase [bacterium]
MAEKFRAMRGTHDILPEEARTWRWIEDTFAGVSGRYGYEEIRLPVFEATELFERGTGFATDVVQKEMYTFLDKKGRRLSLRPEATPSVIRAFLEHNLGRRAGVSKFFYMGPMFRYDRPGAGRYRQFHQAGVEIIGSPSPGADAEVIGVFWAFLRELGLTKLGMRINTLGCRSCRIKYSEILKDFLSDKLEALCADCKERYAKNPLRVLDCKVAACKVVIARAPDVSTILCAECVEHFDRVKACLQAAGLSFRVDPKLVRGLDYYTRTVFEVYHEAVGIENSLGGGGRYDHLVEEFGGPATPAVGFSSGLERVLLAVEAEGSARGASEAADIVFASLGEQAFIEAFTLASEARKRWRVWLEFDQRKLDRQLATAAKLGARLTAIIGDDELARGVVRIKDMASGDQIELRRQDVIAWLDNRLGGKSSE